MSCFDVMGNIVDYNKLVYGGMFHGVAVSTVTFGRNGLAYNFEINHFVAFSALFVAGWTALLFIMHFIALLTVLFNIAMFLSMWLL